MFQFNLEQVTEVIDLGERLTNVQIDDKLGTVAKYFNFLSFQVPVKIL